MLVLICDHDRYTLVQGGLVEENLCSGGLYHPKAQGTVGCFIAEHFGWNLQKLSRCLQRFVTCGYVHINIHK